MPAPALHIAEPPRTRSPRPNGRLRVDLAAAYRLVALFGWDDLVFTHISARVPGREGEFLINPYGLMFEEITASSLIKVDMHGNKLDDSPFPVNPAGLRDPQRRARRAPRRGLRDAHCTRSTASRCRRRRTGCCRCRSTRSSCCRQLGYHDYEGVALRDDEKPRLVADLGDKKLPDAAQPRPADRGRLRWPTPSSPCTSSRPSCTIQVRAQAGGGELVSVAPEIIATAGQQSRGATRGQGAQLVWPGLLRRLDRRFPGYDT